MPVKRNKKKENRTIPILFTFGIIGWGFFAIDQLTSRKDTESRLEKKFYNLEEKKTNIKETSSMKRVTEWLHSKLSQLEHSRKKSSLTDQGLDEGENKKTKGNTRGEYEKIKLYFYKSNSPELRLYLIERTLSEKDIEQNKYIAIGSLIKGPTTQEKAMNYLDSFPTKPRLLSVRQNGDVLVINLDSSFAKNLNYQMVRHQLKQLLKTAKQFDDILSIELQINSKRIKTIGMDQLALPKKISEGSWIFSQQF